MLFRKFSGRKIVLLYLNATIKVKKKDVYLLQFAKVYHGVLVNIKRQALIYTNHTTIIRRFCNIDTINLFTKINKM